MMLGFHVRQYVNDNWIVEDHMGSCLISAKRRWVAEAYGKALAHHAKVSLIVHRHGGETKAYSKGDLTYSTRL